MAIKNQSKIAMSLILSVGIVIAGYSVGKGIYRSRLLNRTVSVKGISEMTVQSNLGIWEINYREIGNELSKIEQAIQHDETVVREFLKSKGFSDTEIDISLLKVEDRLANVYNQSQAASQESQRYVVTSGLRIRSNHVESIKSANQVISELLQKGVPLAFDVSTLSPNPSYYYTNLDAIRPKMMSDATKSAFAVAEQFAHDANISLQGIQRASQGVFQIMGSDTSTLSSDWNSNQNALGSVNKQIRLVTTIEYRIR